MKLLYSLIAALLLVGCSSAVQTETIRLPMPEGTKLAAGEMAPTITMFSKQFDVFTSICGAVVQYGNGEPAQMIQGACNSPLSLIMGAPLNAGLAAAVAASIH